MSKLRWGNLEWGQSGISNLGAGIKILGTLPYPMSVNGPMNLTEGQLPWSFKCKVGDLKYGGKMGVLTAVFTYDHEGSPSNPITEFCITNGGVTKRWGSISPGATAAIQPIDRPFWLEDGVFKTAYPDYFNSSFTTPSAPPLSITLNDTSDNAEIEFTFRFLLNPGKTVTITVGKCALYG